MLNTTLLSTRQFSSSHDDVDIVAKKGFHRLAKLVKFKGSIVHLTPPKASIFLVHLLTSSSEQASKKNRNEGNCFLYDAIQILSFAACSSSALALKSAIESSVSSRTVTSGFMRLTLRRPFVALVAEAFVGVTLPSEGLPLSSRPAES